MYVTFFRGLARDYNDRAGPMKKPRHLAVAGLPGREPVAGYAFRLITWAINQR